MKLPKITETLIRQNTTAQSLKRGYEYSHEGAVLNLLVRDGHLVAAVAGSEYEPYQVEIDFNPAGITRAWCSCPYSRAGWCKHIAAVLLTMMEAPERVEERPALVSLIADLDRDELKGLILYLAESNAQLTDPIERYVKDLQGSGADSLDRRSSLEPELYRRRVHDIVHSLDGMRRSEAYWHVSRVVAQVAEVLNEAWGFIHAGHGEHALPVLEGITAAYTDGWYGLDDSDGYASGFFRQLADVWMAAVLAAELTEVERRGWASKLARWQSELEKYGIGVFYPVIDALQPPPTADLTS